ncbi:MAG TPA: sigma-70 family RNA polymerase sigma factor [Pseudomonadales bacterium]|nr:sigma-70 family RNA polymerase sigma factor [Pseudomonadales bacterium]
MTSDSNDLARARDRALARRMCGGDEAAIAEFCRDYLPRVYRFAAARVRVEADADDVVQNVMRNAARRIETYRGEATLLSWLLQICRRELAKRYARLDRQPTQLAIEGDDALRDLIDSIEASQTSEPEHAVLREELTTRLRRALEELPDRYADALEMKYVDDLSSKEIAEQLGIGDEATQSLLARARRALRGVFAATEWSEIHGYAD